MTEPTGNSSYQIGKPSIDYNTKLISPKGRGPASYLEVKYRMQLLRELFPEAEVITDNVHLDMEKLVAVFHARVVLPNGAIGEGTGSETARDFPDFIEKAETKAIGRALTAAGIGHQYGIADFEYEGESPKNYVGVDGEMPPRQRPAPAQAAPAREPAARPAARPLVQPPVAATATADPVIDDEDDDSPAAVEARQVALLRQRDRLKTMDIFDQGAQELFGRTFVWREFSAPQQKTMLAWLARQATPTIEDDLDSLDNIESANDAE